MTEPIHRCADCAADISDRRRALRCTTCRDRRRRSKMAVLQPRNCLACGAEYQPRGGLQKWCKSCVWDSASRFRMAKVGPEGLARYRRDLAAGSRTSVCVTCGDEFTYRYVGGTDRAYCDAHASTVVMSNRAGQHKRKGRRGALDVPRVCPLCGHAYYANHPQQKYCTECVGTRSERHRAKRYGVPAGTVREMQDRYGGRCWICRTRPGACLDHDHATGAVRGWLCRACNGALHYMERPDWMVAASEYLTKVGARDDLVASFAMGSSRPTV